MLLIYEQSTGNIVGINSTEGATFDNVYPDVSIEFKKKYDGIVIDYNKDIANDYSKYKVLNKEVMLKTFEELNPLLSKEEKTDELNRLCNKTILSGFYSSALGEQHHYGADYEDQINLVGKITEINNNPDMTTIMWKTKDAGILSHTVEQFKQVYKDGVAYKESMINLYWQKKYQVENATTLEEVNSIVWDISPIVT